MKLPSTLFLSSLLLASAAPSAWPGHLPSPWPSQKATTDSPEEANKLRNASVTDYNAGRHIEAVAKLEKALEMYRRLPGEYLDESAVVLRAITWNYMHAKDMGLALAAFDDLCDLRGTGPMTDKLKAEVGFAYGALYKGASQDPKDNGRLLTKVRKRVAKLKLDGLLSQVMHDQGSLATDQNRKSRDVLPHFEDALRLRTKLKDATGSTWTRNGIVRFHLDRGELELSSKPLLAAYRSVLEEGISEPQRAVEGHVERFFEMLEQIEQPDRELVQSAWSLACVGEELKVPRMLPKEFFQAAAARAQARRKGKRHAREAAVRLEDVSAQASTSAARTIQVVQAARLIAATDPALALGWLDSITLESGPCELLLRARRATAIAVAAAHAGDPARFDLASKEAIEAFNTMKSHFERRDALEEMVAAGEALANSNALQERKRELDIARRAGGPGGRGASASSAPRTKDIATLGYLDAVFELTLDGEQLVVRDLLGEGKWMTDTSWSPHNVTYNGLALRIWGGYVSVLSINSGAASGARGSRGNRPKDLEVSFLPMTENKTLVVTKNGACYYAKR